MSKPVGGKKRATAAVNKITFAMADFDYSSHPFDLLIGRVLEGDDNLTTVAKGSTFEIIVMEFLKIRYAQNAFGHSNGTSVELTSAQLGSRSARAVDVPMPEYGDGGRDIVLVDRSQQYGIWVVDCKAYGASNHVGAKDVRSVIGALMTEPLTRTHGAKAVVVTTSAISSTAQNAINSFTDRFGQESPYKGTHPYMMEGWDRATLRQKFDSLDPNQRMRLIDQVRTALVENNLLELVVSR